MTRTHFAAFLTLAVAPALFAQRGAPLPDMQTIASSLGVTCEHCHVAAPGTRAPEPKKDIARAMIAMTRELNEKVQAATGKAPPDAVAVTCATCHHGLPVPGTLNDVMLREWKTGGSAGSIAKYRELREKFYGKAAYDFSEDTLLAVAGRLVQVKPDDAIAMLKLDLEFSPKSAKAYAQLGYAYTRKFDDEAAIANYEKSLQLEPNGIVEGQLAQLKSYRRK